MLLTVLTDIIHFSIYYPTADLVGRDMYRFSAAMAILSLLLKPISCFFVYQMYRERGGEYNVNFGKCSNFIYSQKNFLMNVSGLRPPDCEALILNLQTVPAKLIYFSHMKVRMCPIICYSQLRNHSHYNHQNHLH